MHDPSLRTRRPLLFESFVETNDVEAERRRRDRRDRRAPAAPRGGSPAASAAPAPGERDGASASIVAPPKDYYGIRLGPYKYIEWPDGEKELYDINKDPYELNNIVRDPQLLPDPRLPARRTGPPRDLRRPHLPGSRRRNSR